MAIMKPVEISDEQIEQAFVGTNYGEGNDTPEWRKRHVAEAVAGISCNYHMGHTTTRILLALGLIKGETWKYRHPGLEARRWAYNVMTSYPR